MSEVEAEEGCRGQVWLPRASGNTAACGARKKTIPFSRHKRVLPPSAVTREGSTGSACTDTLPPAPVCVRAHVPPPPGRKERALDSLESSPGLLGDQLACAQPQEAYNSPVYSVSFPCAPRSIQFYAPAVYLPTLDPR